jgi:hypothetical protein
VKYGFILFRHIIKQIERKKKIIKGNNLQKDNTARKGGIF